MTNQNPIQEVWTNICGYDGLYQISSLGRVKSFAKPNGPDGRILGGKNQNGYRQVTLRRGQPLVHRLVGYHFIPNPLNLPCINHKDRNKLNNAYWNLEWCTIGENLAHARKMGFRLKPIDLNKQIDRLFKNVPYYVSPKTINESQSKKMILLPNNCYCSTPAVHPKNWKTVSASLAAKWYIQFYFYEPGKKGKLIIIKGLANQLQTIPERRKAMQIMMDGLMNRLKTDGYNPVTKISVPEYRTNFEIDPATPFIDAFNYVLPKLKIKPHTREDVKSVITGMEKSARQLNLTAIPVADLQQKHVKLLLDNLNKSADRYNKYRSYLTILFTELKDMQVIERNPIIELRKQKVTRAQKKVLTLKERVKINDHLKKNNYPFWRFMQIFFHSGGRETELMGIKLKDVDLKAQTYNVLIEKGKSAHWQQRTIKDIVLPLWKELKGKPADHLFSRGLVPGASKIRTEQITRRWRTWVKEPLDISCDFYSLKHLAATETVDMLGNKATAIHLGHTSTQMVDSVYDVRSKKRLQEAVKSLDNKFA
jgi:integrase